MRKENCKKRNARKNTSKSNYLNTKSATLAENMLSGCTESVSSLLKSM